MKREKFVYNIHTLRYEKVITPLKAKFFKGFMVFSGVAVYTFIMFHVLSKFVDSPKNKELNKELSNVKEELKMYNKELTMLHAAIDNVQKRDNGIRAIHELAPIDENLWNAGTGGREQYEQYKNYSDRELLAQTAAKVEKLKTKLALVTKSHNEIIDEFKRKEDRMQAIPSLLPVREDLLNKDKNLMSGFGYRLHPVYKVRKLHTGIDFGARHGTPIFATGKGTVVRVEYGSTGYGHNVVISHGYGFETLYGHMDKISVQPGQEIKRGQQIGTVGSTGTSTAPHLHYEVIKNGEKINPMPYCLDGLTPDQYQSLIERASQSMSSFEF